MGRPYTCVTVITKAARAEGYNVIRVTSQGRFGVSTHEVHVRSNVYSQAYTIDRIKISRYWPFVRGIHRWPVIPPTKGQ